MTETRYNRNDTMKKIGDIVIEHDTMENMIHDLTVQQTAAQKTIADYEKRVLSQDCLQTKVILHRPG